MLGGGRWSAPPHRRPPRPPLARARTPGGTPVRAATAGAVSVRPGAARRARCSAALGAPPRRSQRGLGRFGPRELLPKGLFGHAGLRDLAPSLCRHQEKAALPSLYASFWCMWHEATSCRSSHRYDSRTTGERTFCTRSDHILRMWPYLSSLRLRPYHRLLTFEGQP